MFSELALQLEKDYVADVCIYPKRKIHFSAGDVIKVTEAPLMVVEILSPTPRSLVILGAIWAISLTLLVALADRLGKEVGRYRFDR